MPPLELVIGTDYYKPIDVPEGCNVGRWKQYVAEGLLGQKILYAERLVCRVKLGSPELKDSAALPVPPERLYVEGRPPIIKVLQLALKDKLKPDKKGPQLMHPRPPTNGGESWSRNSLARGRDGVLTAAAKVFAQELDEATIRKVWARFPNYTGELPHSAVFWSEGDLERFFASGGQLRPMEVAEPGGQTCALLRKLRLELAERGISKVTPDYKALSRHLSSLGFKGMAEDLPEGAATLPSSAGVSEVRRASRAPKALREPLVLPWLPGERDDEEVTWDLDFWKREHGDWLWTCRATAPAFEGDDAGGPDSVAVQATVAEFVEYALVLEEEDAALEEEAAVAYFRVQMEGWPAFTQAMWPTFEQRWKDLTPPGVEDHTLRWVRMFADKFNTDWLQFYARYFSVSLAAPGCITRLRTENNGAHLWLAQLEGRRLVFLFAPREWERLYGMTGGRVEGREGYTAAASSVDIFAPSAKRHPRFAEAKAQSAVLEPGETLLIPSGWWWYSVALEPSATVQQNFFNGSNHRHMCREIEDKMVQYGELAPDAADGIQAALAELQEEISEDTEEWGLVVTEGGS